MKLLISESGRKLESGDDWELAIQCVTDYAFNKDYKKMPRSKGTNKEEYPTLYLKKDEDNIPIFSFPKMEKVSLNQKDLLVVLMVSSDQNLIFELFPRPIAK